MKRLYLILAIAGAILPYFFFGQYIFNNGLNLPGFVSSLFANPPATGFTVDLLFISFVFWIMMIHQRKQGKGPNPILFIILNLLIGLSCAFPAYLYARSSD
jgi:hypothetical protein